MEKYTILYVDDEESNLRIFKDTFRRRFNVFTASSAKEGIKLLEENHIDLILSDQRMPEMSGVEFLKYTFQKYPKTNRILVTGYSDINAVENAINQARVFQYVQKPWSEESLMKIIEDALRIYQLEQENVKQKEELIKAKRIAEQNDQLKTEFINNFSHEIRTPLNGIYGFAQILDNPELTYEQRKDYISIIQNSSDELVRVIDYILEYSLLTSKQAEFEPKYVCINKMLNELFSVFNLRAESYNLPLKLKTALSDEKSTIYTDKSKLYHIISNLLENAFKFTQTGYIEYGYTLVKNSLEIYVKDTGMGIHPANQEIIFNRFTQIEKEISVRSGGLGLGLAIAAENAKLINANIRLKSEIGQGSTFFISVPYITVDTKKELIHEINKIKKSLDTIKDIKILVAEDNEINFLFIKSLLIQLINEDITILHAQNGKETLEIYKKNPDVDMILMDIKMPLINGYEATSRIKELNPKVPIIAQTAYSTNEDKDKAKSAGCDDFISKPIHEEELGSVLVRFLC